MSPEGVRSGVYRVNERLGEVDFGNYQANIRFIQDSYRLNLMINDDMVINLPPLF